MSGKKVLISLILTLGIFLLIPTTFSTVNAERSESELKEDRSELQEELKEKREELVEIQDELVELEDEIVVINELIKDNEAEIANTETEIEEREDEIAILEEEIEQVEADIELRSDILKDRAASLQRSGGSISYMDVLFGAQSFTDFIDRVSLVTKITQSDQSLIKNLQEDKDKVNEQRQVVADKLEELEAIVIELEHIRELTLVQKEELEEKREELEEKQEISEQLIEELEIEDLELERMITAARRRAEQERQARLAQQKSVTQFSSNTTVTPEHSSSRDEEKNDHSGGGSFIRPAIGGYISSTYGPRWGSFHSGIDFARPSNRNILASADGVVESAGYVGSYGNRIVINHNNGYKTLYAHLSSINVTVGQAVSQGTKIGVMGSTGRSTGVHLHFEVVKNGSNINPMNVLNLN